MPDTDLSKLGSELVIYSGRLVRAVRRQLGDEHRPEALRLLAQIRERGPISITALAHAERCSQPTMSTAVRALESKGWVQREADPRDARATLISLSPSGTAELDRAHQKIGAVVADWLAATDHSTEDVRRAVDVVRAALAASHQPDGNDAQQASPEVEVP